MGSLRRLKVLLSQSPTPFKLDRIIDVNRALFKRKH